MKLNCNKKTCVILDIELIPLTQEKYSIVDKEDYAVLSKRKWAADKHNKGFRAIKHMWNGKKYETLYMHREIMGVKKGEKLFVDHINHNQLDNRKSNLRKCTPAQNSQNKRVTGRGTSKYKGVCWFKRVKKWTAYIDADGKRRYLGYFENENDAAIAYNNAAKKYHKDFAYFNNVA